MVRAWWGRSRGLTFLEMVMALALMFIGAGGVMSILIAGAGWPTRLQQASTRDTLAKELLTQMMVAGAVPASTPFTPIPGYPTFEARVVVSPANFDSNASVLEVSVRGPMPRITTISTLRGVYTQPNAMQLLSQYGCMSCHAVGTGTTTAGPTLNLSNLSASANAAAAASGQQPNVDRYIEESIRNPASYVVGGYTVQMAGLPGVNDMPPEDLNAIRAYLKTL